MEPFKYEIRIRWCQQDKKYVATCPALNSDAFYGETPSEAVGSLLKWAIKCCDSHENDGTEPLAELYKKNGFRGIS